jgi:phospholipase/carboxylesterase
MLNPSPGQPTCHRATLSRQAASRSAGPGSDDGVTRAPHLASHGRLDSRPGAPASSDLRPGVHALDDVGLPDTLLVVTDRVTDPAPLLVFFHGAGGDGRSILPLVRDTAAQRGVVLLLPTSAASTWDLRTGGLGRDVAALDAALEHVFAHAAIDRMAFGGFSDGASYALSLGVANGDLAEAVLAFSPGFVAPPAQHGAPRVWVSHGTADQVLPVDRCGRRVVATLTDAGYGVHYEEFDGGHVVLPHLTRAAFAWWLR